MKKSRFGKGFWLLVFLAFFGLSIGIFDYYRDLWMSANEITTTSISHVKSISNIVTVLALFYFTLRVPVDKLKKGMNVVLVLKMIVEGLLILLNGSKQLFLIKFLMFFDIAFTQLILSSVYPLMMNFAKDDEVYTKKGFVESFFDKMGFLLGSILIGKTVLGGVIDYNACLVMCLVFTFVSFIILSSVKIKNIKDKDTQMKAGKAIKYFRKNKIFLFFLGHNMLGSVIWATVVGMPLLLLTRRLGFMDTDASFLVLGLGVVSTVMSMIVVKYLRFKNDHINMIFKFGIRVILYTLTFITGNPYILIATIIYMLLTNSTHNFIFSSFFINNVDEEYSMVLTTLKYCGSLLGDAIGVFILGIFFESTVRMMVLPAVILGVIHYLLGTVLIEKKKRFERSLRKAKLRTEL